jgi:hypothetical protein
VSAAPRPSPASAALIGRRGALLGALSIACGRSEAKVAQQPVLAPPRYSGKLEDYVPAAGLRWMLRGSPAKLAESQSFRPALDTLLTRDRLRAVADTTGFALETLPRALIAGFDLGTLYLAQLPTPTAGQARARFKARQIHDFNERRPDPNVVVLTGINEGIPTGLVTIDDQVVAYGVGDPRLMRVVEGYARGKLKAKRAFQGAALAGLEQETDDAPISAHVPGPFEERWQGAAGGLLAVTTAVSAKLVPTSAGHVTLELVLHGDFAESHAVERLRSAYMSVASSSTGTALGLGNALDPRCVTNMQSDRVALVVPLPLTEIASGARAVTSGDLADILRIAPHSTEGPAPTSSPGSR